MAQGKTTPGITLLHVEHLQLDLILQESRVASAQRVGESPVSRRSKFHLMEEKHGHVRD